MRVKLHKNYSKQYRIDFLQFCLYSYYGARIENLQKGHFNKLYCYDINSSYPNTIRNLNSFLKSEIDYYNFNNFNYDRLNFNLYDDGIIKCKIKQKNNFLNPFIINNKNHNINLFPNGNFISYIHLFEYNIFKNFENIEIIPLEAYLIKYHNNIKPFSYVNDLYKLRLKYKKENNPMETIIKIIMNAIYGNCFQLSPIRQYKPYSINLVNYLRENDINYSQEIINNELFLNIKNRFKAGILNNIFYASKITAETRLNLLLPFFNNKNNGFIKEIKDIISFATDSIIIKNKIDNKLKISDSLGDWKLEINNKPGLIILNGIYQIGETFKFRGVKKDLNLFEILKLNKNNNSNIITFNTKKRISHSTENFNDFNIIKEIPYELDINDNKKRNFNKEFRVKDLINNNYNSKCKIINDGIIKD